MYPFMRLPLLLPYWCLYNFCCVSLVVAVWCKRYYQSCKGININVLEKNEILVVMNEGEAFIYFCSGICKKGWKVSGLDIYSDSRCFSRKIDKMQRESMWVVQCNRKSGRKCSLMYGLYILCNINERMRRTMTGVVRWR